MTVTTTTGNPGQTLGACIRRYRMQAGLTQTDVERVTQGRVKREYLSSIELGRIAVIYPTVFRELHRVLKFPAWEVLEAMGYPTDLAERGVEPGILARLRRLSLRQQRATVGLLDAILGTADAIRSDRHRRHGRRVQPAQ